MSFESSGGSGGRDGAGGGGERPVPTQLDLDRETSEEDDDGRTRRRRDVPRPAEQEAEDDVRPGPSNVLDPNVEDVLPFPLLRTVLWVIFWTVLVAALYFGDEIISGLARMTYTTMIISGLILPILVAIFFYLSLFPMAASGTLKRVVAPESLLVVHLESAIYLITGYSCHQEISMVLVGDRGMDVARFLYGVPSLQLENRFLRVTHELQHIRLTDLKHKRPIFHKLPQPADFVSLFLIALRSLKLFDDGHGATNQNSGLLPGRVMPLCNARDIHVTALTQAFGPTNQPKFIGRRVVDGSMVRDPRAVTSNRLMALDDVYVRDQPPDDTLLDLTCDLLPRRLCWYNRHSRTHMLSSGYTDLAARSYEACANIIYEMDLCGSSASQSNLTRDLAQRGIVPV